MDAVMAGYNATVLAYGQTGAGKTYTMIGETGEKMGMTGLALKKIFQSKKVKATMAVMQIYQEFLFDLLGEDTPLQIRQVD